jgi:hypothetical protein
MAENNRDAPLSRSEDDQLRIGELVIPGPTATPYITWHQCSSLGFEGFGPDHFPFASLHKLGRVDSRTR